MSQLQRIPLLLITQCPDGLMWYRHRVGQFVPHVGWTADSGFISREPAGFVNFVRSADARPVEIYVKPSELTHWPFNSRPLATPSGAPTNPFTAPERESRALPTGQSHKHSLIETAVNVGSGWLISLGVTAVVMPAFGHAVTWGENVAITCIFTAVSLVRSYGVRRFFNHIHQRQTT